MGAYHLAHRCFSEFKIKVCVYKEFISQSNSESMSQEMDSLVWSVQWGTFTFLKPQWGPWRSWAPGAHHLLCLTHKIPSHSDRKEDCVLYFYWYLLLNISVFSRKASNFWGWQCWLEEEKHCRRVLIALSLTECKIMEESPSLHAETTLSLNPDA